MQGLQQPQTALQPGGSPGEPASPEEQALYEDLVLRAEAVLAPEQEQISGEILANLKGDFDPQVAQLLAGAEPPIANSPQDSVSATATVMMMAIEAQAEKDGTRYPDEVVQHAGTDVVELLVAVSEAAGIHDFDEQEMDGMYYRAVDLYRLVSPRADEEALKGHFSTLVQANEAGQMDKVLPGLPGGSEMQGGKP